MSDRFKPENFQVVESAPDDLVFDAEVAAAIVNSVWDHNKPGHGGNNYSPTSYLVDPTGELENGAPNRDRLPQDRDYTFITSFPAYHASEGNIRIPYGEQMNNGMFAEAVQATFDQGERRNRLSAEFTAGFIGIPAVAGAVGEFLAIETSAATAIAVGTFAVLFNGVTLPAGAASAYRRMITNPNYNSLNKRHLRKAAERVEAMRLPPVVA